MEVNDKELFRETIDLEKVFLELFSELGLKPVQCQLIRAFLVVSNGKLEFEASNTDLAKILYNTSGYDKNANSNVGYAISVLEKWQHKNKLTLVEIVQKGSKTNDLTKAKTIYQKSKYRFILLAEAAKAYSENPENRKKVIQDLVAYLRESYVPAKEKPKYHSYHNIKKAKNNIFTYLKKIYQFAIEVGEEPYNRCEKVLNECWNILSDLDAEHTESRDREKFITEFESKLNPLLLKDNHENNSN